MKRRKSIIRNILGGWLLAVGVALLLYPGLMELKLSADTTGEIARFEETYQPEKETGQGETSEPEKETGQEKTEENPEKTRLRQAVLQYNQKIYTDHQADFSDPYSLCQVPVTLEGLKSACFGYIEIPAMKVKLALFVGASEKNMAKGAVILSQTSMPVGGINTNSVIAAHRGYRGAAYFREIEKLHPGDMVYIENPWEILCYKAVETEIIDPCDSDRVKIKEGKDMVTLLTCHPYRSHGRNRYLVYCERVTSGNEKENAETGDEKDGQEKAPQKRTEAEESSSESDIQREKYVRIAAAFAIAFMCAGVLLRKERHER